MKNFIGKIFTPRFITGIILFLILMSVYTLIRILFYAASYQHYTNFSGGMVFLSFIHGLKFDASAIMMLNVLFLVLYNLPFKNLYRIYSRVLVVFFCPLIPFLYF